MTLALAIVGTVAGLVGTALALITLLRDRPRLVVTSSLSHSVSRGKEVSVLVANHGRQAVAILEAGVIEEMGTPPAASAVWYPEEQELVRLEPGSAHEIRIKAPEKWEANRPLWAFARDSSHRTVRAKKPVDLSFFDGVGALVGEDIEIPDPPLTAPNGH